jgi:hypothetical protein
MSEGNGRTDLEESLQPPHLEDALANKDRKLEDTPPLDPSVGTLGSVSVDSFSHHDVGLLVAHLGQGLGEATD